MRRIQQPIAIVAESDTQGEITPIRFRFTDVKKIERVVKIGKIIRQEREQRAGKMIRIFHCQSYFQGEQRRYELEYHEAEWRWYLSKW